MAESDSRVKKRNKKASKSKPLRATGEEIIKPDAVEYEKRIRDARKLILAHGSRQAAERELEQRYGVSARTAARYAAEASARMLGAAVARKGDEDGVFAEHRERVLAVLRAAWEEMNLKVALESTKTLMALDGLPVRRVEHTGKDGGPMIHVATADITSALAAQAAKVDLPE